MSDIVDRLRESVRFANSVTGCSIKCRMNTQAADEIERLRGQASEAYRLGQKDMRERAAQMLGDESNYWAEASHAEDDIRALPILDYDAPQKSA